MINFPTEKQLKTLQNFNKPLSLTIYAPSIDPNARTNPNFIELKNLLREAEKTLRSAGATDRHIKKTIRPARSLLENPLFWPASSESLAMFMHPKLFQHYYIPDHVAPYMLTVGHGFNLEPINNALRDNKSYLVLTLSHNNVQLYEGDQYRLKPVEIKGFPANLKQTLGIDEYPRALETHPVGPARGDKSSESFHGHYNKSQTDKKMLTEFFRRIDRRLHGTLFQRKVPLVIAGVNYLLPIYRQVNTYPGLVASGITGNLDKANKDYIRTQAWELISQTGHRT